jgi:hypothetical protein
MATLPGGKPPTLHWLAAEDGQQLQRERHSQLPLERRNMREESILRALGAERWRTLEVGVGGGGLAAVSRPGP